MRQQVHLLAGDGGQVGAGRHRFDRRFSVDHDDLRAVASGFAHQFRDCLQGHVRKFHSRQRADLPVLLRQAAFGHQDFEHLHEIAGRRVIRHADGLIPRQPPHAG